MSLYRVFLVHQHFCSAIRTHRITLLASFHRAWSFQSMYRLPCLLCFLEGQLLFHRVRSQRVLREIEYHSLHPYFDNRIFDLEAEKVQGKSLGCLSSGSALLLLSTETLPYILLKIIICPLPGQQLLPFQLNQVASPLTPLIDHQ